MLKNFFILLIIGVIVLGPERIPGYAAQLGRIERKSEGWPPAPRNNFAKNSART
ncbi:hypothetical protein ABIB14_001503 [Arthrobacter sp. UYEF3]